MQQTLKSQKVVEKTSSVVNNFVFKPSPLTMSTQLRHDSADDILADSFLAKSTCTADLWSYTLPIFALLWMSHPVIPEPEKIIHMDICQDKINLPLH